MISAVVLTKNSAASLARCLKSLLWCREIIVIDDYSTDETLKIAGRFKVRIFKRKLDADFSAQRNFGLEKARNDWVLFLDSDEEISKPAVPADEYSGYLLKRKDFWLGREIKYGETDINLLRLARKNTGRWKRKVHEYWDVKGKIANSNAAIIHHPHPTLGEFVGEIASYSTIHAWQNRKESKKANVLKVLLFPFLKFIRNYIFRRGYKDGVHGFVIAGIMSFHSFLSWSGLWLMSRKKKLQTY